MRLPFKSMALVVGFGLLALGAVSFTVPKGYAKLPVTFSPVSNIKVTVKQQGNNVIAVLPGGKTQALGELPDVPEGGMEIDSLIIQADFNFDGMGDVGLLEGVGYGGVNMFYRLYLWDKTTSKFQDFAKEISNPTLTTATKTLNSAQRSGPRWYTTDYRFTNGKPYTWMETVVVSPEGDLYHAKIYKPDGKLLKTLVAATEDPAEINEKTPPAIRKILPAKAPLYDKPDADSKTRMYVIKGDKVELLDYSGDTGEEWFRIRYKGSRVVEKWVEASAILAGAQ
ncbi:MAG: hypothetical protein KJ914_05575 [Gammaproteobacteria bacterium]|nr:hypothetical protein [Gammaproteobacteria bacterium]MBU1723237.1 hypothetical protein [Gammaproteobacteria bacterium]MBU2007262.1 hypothetical protein [Gammaproteobacteria bacterium]